MRGQLDSFAFGGGSADEGGEEAGAGDRTDRWPLQRDDVLGIHRA
jgi:hypothetical protein